MADVQRPGPTTVTFRGGPASEKFNAGLWQLARKRRDPPCAIPEISHFWVSETAADRDIAVRGCNRCPLTDLCDAAATERKEAFGVWGGVDRTVTR
jgi:hypothetical protein